MAEGSAEPPVATNGASEPVPDKNPTLVPTQSLTPDTFEDFTERVLSAHRFCGPSVRKVVRVERWGRKGDKQDGIDFEGTFSDGRTAAWQCKRHDNLTAPKVRAAVAACTFGADEYYLVYSGEASDAARAEIKKYPKWQLLDQRGLGRLVDDLPLHKRRDVLDATWGVTERKALLEMPGEDGFLSLAAFAADRRNPETVLNDLGPMVGRGAEHGQFERAIDRSADRPPILLVSGPGGRGKTRLLLEALEEFERLNPAVPVTLLSPGMQLNPIVMAELPHVPAVVVVDDAHHDPAALSPLLMYARTVPGTQLVLATRPTGTVPLRAQVVAARYSSSQIHEVAVGQLSKPEARELVTSLADGLEIRWPVREYFANQAVDSPFVAVVAVNLLRRGELTTPLGLDAGLREQILARYQELSLDDVEENPARRLLAVYAALGSVDDDDTQLVADIAKFCELQPVHALRLIAQLKDRGVLITRSGQTRVTPDVLADEILEREAAVGKTDTGFVRELWTIFGSRFATRLIAQIAELDWRLAQQDGPAVFPGVWEAVRTDLQATELAELPDELRTLKGLTATQPRLLIEALGEVLARVEEPDDENSERTRFVLAELYGGCAVYDPELLETALDALWWLRRHDHRPPNQHPEHPERIIVKKLADIGVLPDPSFPERIVRRVEAWLAESEGDHDVVSPLFALEPLLKKDGYRTEQDAPSSLAFKPYAVSVEWARPIRDRIREVLRAEASSADLRRAGAAVDLLGDALRQLRGAFGYSPGAEEVLSWQEDDLATLAVLAEVAGNTSHAVLRRLIRHTVTWSADRAMSLPLRHQALTLITELDKHEDDLAEFALGRGRVTSTSRAGVPIPTLTELQQEAEAKAVAQSGLTVEERQAHSTANIGERVERKRAEHDALAARVVARLTAPGSDAVSIVRTLDEVSREIRLLGPRGGLPQFLLSELANARPELSASLADELAANEPGPLDEQLSLLLSRWAQQSDTALLAWLAMITDQREAVRLAAANAMTNSGWANRGGSFTTIFQQGMNDPDPQVRDQYLLGAHALLNDFPTDTAEMLLTADISRDVAAGVLERACNYNGSPWGTNLSETDATAVLRLVEQAEWSDYTTEQIAAGIARSHPILVLEKLKATAVSGRPIPVQIEGLGAAFSDNARELARWLIDEVTNEENAGATVMSLVMAEGMTQSQADHLEAAVSDLAADSLVGLANALSAVRTWPVFRLDLARQMLAGSRGSNHHENVRSYIAAAMWPSHWTSANGTSPELARVRSHAVQAAASEPDEELKEDLEKLANALQDMQSFEARRYEKGLFS